MIEEFRPKDLPDYMMPAWVGALSWVISQPDAIAEFQNQTGNKWSPGASAIERMIDEATGADKAFIAAFIGWFNEHVWGPMDGPPCEEGGDRC